MTKSRLICAILAANFMSSSASAVIMLGATWQSQFAQIDLLDAKATQVGTTESFTHGMTYNYDRGIMYSSTTGGISQLLSLDYTTGQSTVIGNIGTYNFVIGLAFDNANQILYGVDNGTDTLLSIDLDTGNPSVIGALGADGVSGLAFDDRNGILYGIARASSAPVSINNLVEIDTETGSASTIGTTAFYGISALEYDEANETLYAIDSLSSNLLIIDTDDATSRIVGSIGDLEITAIAIIPEPSSYTMLFCGIVLSATILRKRVRTRQS